MTLKIGRGQLGPIKFHEQVKEDPPDPHTAQFQACKANSGKVGQVSIFDLLIGWPKSRSRSLILNRKLGHTVVLQHA